MARPKRVIPWSQARQAIASGQWDTLLALVGPQRRLHRDADAERWLGLVARSAVSAPAAVVDAMLARCPETLVVSARQRAWVVAVSRGREDTMRWFESGHLQAPDVLRWACERRAWKVAHTLLTVRGELNADELERTVAQVMTAVEGPQPVCAGKALDAWEAQQRDRQRLQALLLRMPHWNASVCATALKGAVELGQDFLFQQVLDRSAGHPDERAYGRVAQACVRRQRLDLLDSLEAHHPLHPPSWTPLVIQALRLPDPSFFLSLTSRPGIQRACRANDHAQLVTAILVLDRDPEQQKELFEHARSCFSIMPIQERLKRWVHGAQLGWDQLIRLASWLPVDTQAAWAERWPERFNAVLANTRASLGGCLALPERERPRPRV